MKKSTMKRSEHNSPQPHAVGHRSPVAWVVVLAALSLLAGWGPEEARAQPRGEGVEAAPDARASATTAPVPENLEPVTAALSELARPWVVDHGLRLSTVVAMRVGADGSVRRVEVVEGLLPLPLKKEIIEALGALHFSPARSGGRAVPARVHLPLLFRKGRGDPGTR